MHNSGVHLYRKSTQGSEVSFGAVADAAMQHVMLCSVFLTACLVKMQLHTLRTTAALRHRTQSRENYVCLCLAGAMHGGIFTCFAEAVSSDLQYHPQAAD